MDEDDAHMFGKECCTVCDQGFFIKINEFLNEYNEDWQKEVLLYLVNKDYRHYHNEDMPEWEMDNHRRLLYNIQEKDPTEDMFDFPLFEEDDVTNKQSMRRGSNDDSLIENILDMMFDRDEDFNDDEDGIGSILSKD